MKKTALAVLLCLAASLAAASNGGPAFAFETDPLVVARAAADHELFGALLTDPAARPEFTVHHNLLWEDGTLMSGVATLYDRAEELGAPLPRYLDYLEAWADRPLNRPLPIAHGDQVCAGWTYIWLYERTGNQLYLHRTDPLVRFIFTGRKFSQYPYGFHHYWMRLWNDDTHMVPPFLALRGQAVGNEGMPDGKDGREIAMIYCRSYSQALRDPATGLFWHDPRSIGKYQWGRGNGWVAAGFTKVLKALGDDPTYAEDAAWLKDQLRAMAATLKDNRNVVGTWNSDVLDRVTYPAPETSGSVFFVYMMAYLINQGDLGPEYVPVVQKAWHFLKLSVRADGALMRVQPVGRGSITDDFQMHSETFGVGGLLLAATEMSRLPPEVLAGADKVECVNLAAQELGAEDGRAVIALSRLRDAASDFPAAPAGRVQAVVAGEVLPSTEVHGDDLIVSALPAGADVSIFYQP